MSNTNVTILIISKVKHYKRTIAVRLFQITRRKQS